MTSTQRDDLRRLQDRLTALLIPIPAYCERWHAPVWPGGPSPDELQRLLYPAWRPLMVEMIDHLEERCT